MKETGILNRKHGLLPGRSMLFLHLIIIFLSTLVMSNVPATATNDGASPTGAHEWKIGYWAWEASYIPFEMKTGGKPVDILYVQAGECRASARESVEEQVQLRLPARLPAAQSYIAVLRFAEAKIPDTGTIGPLIRSYLTMKQAAQRDGRNVTGLQLDLDCPGSRLPEYARFLKSLRAMFPAEDKISVTALLDWFRPGTAVADVIGAADEFAPQFYDVAPRRSLDKQMGVAQYIDPAKWGKVFNTFGKPYLIGIASFGRILGITFGKKQPSCASVSAGEIEILSDPPLELLAGDRLVRIVKNTSRAGETMLVFKPRRGEKRRDYCSPAYDEIKMIIPTQQSVSYAYSAAKKMGGWCTGVIFFRLPLANEAMVLDRTEVEAAITGKGGGSRTPQLESDDGLCAAVTCTDLYLRLIERFPDHPLTLRIRSSREMEYFLPEPLLKPNPYGEHDIQITIPAYAGVPRIFIGRAITLDPAEFTLEEPVK